MKKYQDKLFGENRHLSRFLHTLTWSWVFAACLFFIAHVSAQVPENVSEKADLHTQALPSIRSIVDKVNPIGVGYFNEIPLLDNRFRIDAEVDKVILVFFREYGSPPIVLVRPDGSKLFVERHIDDESYNWFESNTYDMIELINPTAGPWQALGEILPGSRVVVIADLMLKVQALPDPVFAGEIIKQSSYLLNAGQQVNFSEFKNVVRLSVDFFSTNNPDFDNFGIGSKNIAEFEDNGLGLDEKPSDGIFTGEFELDVINGQWQPIYSIRTPLFNREQRTDPILVLPNPISFSHVIHEPEEVDEAHRNIQDSGSVEENTTEVGYHRILINIDPSYIDDSSLLLEGAIRSPDGNTEDVAITEMGEYQREIIVLNSGYGRYAASLRAFATTLNGREIVLNAPNYSFRTEEPEPEPLPVEEPQLTGVPADELVTITPEVEEEPEQDSQLIFTVLIMNLGILLIGSVGILLIADMRNRPDSHFFLRLSQKLKNIKLKKAMPAES